MIAQKVEEIKLTEGKYMRIDGPEAVQVAVTQPCALELLVLGLMMVPGRSLTDLEALRKASEKHLGSTLSYL